jgi:hypothetical protein
MLSDILVFLSFAQRLMDKGDRNRSFADCRRPTLEAASADVADSEHPWQTRFQEMRGPGAIHHTPYLSQVIGTVIPGHQSFLSD